MKLIFIDDGSTDHSYDVLKNLHQRDRRVKVIHFRRNFGKAAALAAGFKRAQGDIIVTLDADLQDLPEEIPSLLRKMDEGYDLISGWKIKRKDSLIRKVASRLFNGVTSFFTGVKLHDFGQAAFKKRRFRAAQADFEKAVAADPQSAAAAYYLGYTYYKLGEPSRRLNENKEKARELFAKAFSLDPTFQPDWGKPAPAK